MRTDENPSPVSRTGYRTSMARSSRDVSPSRAPRPPSIDTHDPTATASRKWTLPDVRATNFHTVHHRMPISGTYVIDPRLEMPADLVHDNPAKRANLSLECGRGSITADIWLVGERAVGQHRDVEKAVIDVHCKSWLGKVDVNLYSLSICPFILTATSNGGNVSIALPPDFVGPITLSTGSLYDSFRPSSFTPFAPSGLREPQTNTSGSGQSGVRTVPYCTSVVFSDAVQARLVTFSEVGGKRTCFIGDYRKAGYTTRKDWTGSMVDIQSSYGNLKVSFVHEPVQQEEGSGCTVM